MKRTLSLLVMLLTVATATFAQDKEKNVKVVTNLTGPSVESFINALGGSARYEIDSLNLAFSAHLDERYFNVLRDCCENGRLRGINLSGNKRLREIPAGAFMSSYINGKPRKTVSSGSGGTLVPLRYITLPKTLKRIGEYAFCCSELEQIDLPLMADDIGNGAFDGCSNLKNVVLRGNKKRSDNAGLSFNDLADNAVLYVQTGLGESYNLSSAWSAFGSVMERNDLYMAMDVNVGDGKTLKDALGGNAGVVDSVTICGDVSLDDMAFLKQTILSDRLVDVDMRNTVIEDGQLYGCVMNSLRMPKRMDKIFHGFLSGAEVEKLTLPDSYDEISYTTFSKYKCFPDSTLVIPEGCRKVDYHAFYLCKSIKTLFLPSTLDVLYPNSLGFSYMCEWEGLPVDVYVNRMFPPVSVMVDNYGYEIDPLEEDGPFGCTYSKESMGCLTRNYRLFVPVGAKQNYESDEYWSHIPTIIETPLLTGTTDGICEAVTTGAGLKTGTSSADGIYTIDGRLVTSDTSARTMARGLYVVRSGGTARKAVMGR